MTEHDNARRYYAYADGFRDGAGVRPYEPRDHEADYERGYRDGQLAKRAACNTFAAEVGYTPKLVGIPARVGDGPRPVGRVCPSCGHVWLNEDGPTCPNCGGK